MIGKVITSLLKANTGLTDIVSETSIYPYVINEDTLLPVIVYTVDSLSTNYHKDGWNFDSITFSVISFSENYGTLQSIAL